MAKPLSPKSVIIRKMIAAHPDLSSSEIAQLCNADPERHHDKIEVTTIDVTIQRNALKKKEEKESEDESEAKTEQVRSFLQDEPRAVARLVSDSPARSSLLDPLDVLDAIEDLKRVAQRLGGYDQVRRIIDRLNP